MHCIMQLPAQAAASAGACKDGRSSMHMAGRNSSDGGQRCFQHQPSLLVGQALYAVVSCGHLLDRLGSVSTPQLQDHVFITDIHDGFHAEAAIDKLPSSTIDSKMQLCALKASAACNPFDGRATTCRTRCHLRLTVSFLCDCSNCSSARDHHLVGARSSALPVLARSKRGGRLAGQFDSKQLPSVWRSR